MPRAVNSAAICRADIPASAKACRTGASVLARSIAAALLDGARYSAPLRPSRTPRAFAACRAAFVRAAIISRSCSATAARMCRVRRVAWGLSQATNSTPESIMVAMKATLRESRSSLAIIRRALCRRQADSAFRSSGQLLRLPLSTSTNSAASPGARQVTAHGLTLGIQPKP